VKAACAHTSGDRADARGSGRMVGRGRRLRGVIDDPVRGEFPIMSGKDARMN
jgi:hypothetical protein